MFRRQRFLLFFFSFKKKKKKFRIPNTRNGAIVGTGETLIRSVNNAEAADPIREWNVIEIILSERTWLPGKAINLTIYRQPSRSRRAVAVVGLQIYYFWFMGKMCRTGDTVPGWIRDAVTFSLKYIHNLSPIKHNNIICVSIVYVGPQFISFVYIPMCDHAGIGFRINDFQKSKDTGLNLNPQFPIYRDRSLKIIWENENFFKF